MPTEIVRVANHDRLRSLGWLGVEWIEHFCVHGPGDIQGRPLGETPLTLELARLLVDAYALDEDGGRFYDSVFYSRPKGSNKSGMAAWVACYEALGPCRFAGWAEGGEVFEWHDFRHVYKPGEPMGRVVTYPYLRILATEEGQTGNVYDAVHFNLKDGPLSEAFPRKDDVGLTRVFLPGGGEIRPSTASSSAKDGGKETWANFDETHLYILPELKRMYQTVRRNLGKRKEAEPWSFETSTMYEPGRMSVAEESHGLARAMLEGKAKGARFLFDHREGPSDTDISDDASLRKGLIEAYGDAATYMPIDRLVSEFHDPRNELQDSLRYFLNRAVASSGRAFDLAAWKRNKRPAHEVPVKGLITLGFDGSLSDDATALIATHVATGVQWPLGIWERDDMHEGWRDAVSAVVAEAHRQYQVWRLYADPSKWKTELSEWAALLGEKVVVAWSTTLYRKTAQALKDYAIAIELGQATNNGDRAFERHIGNACRNLQNMRDDDGAPLWLIQKDRPGSPNKIDAAMAGMLSWQARLDAVAAGAKETGGWILR